MSVQKEETSVGVCTRVYDDIFSQTDYKTGLNKLSDIEISVVIEGSGIHVIGDEADECFRGDMYILAKDSVHGYYAKNRNEKPVICTVTFDPAEILEGEFAREESEHYCYGIFRDKLPVSYAMLNSKFMGEYKKFCEFISEEENNRNFEWISAVKSMLTLLLVRIGRYINLADTVKKENPKEWQMVSAVKGIVAERCSDNELTLESVAAEIYLSASTLSKMFRKAAGVSFADYVRDVRLDRACRILRSTNLTNEEIVRECGLKDVPSFYRIFKNSMGMTPYQYRMSQQTYKGEKTMSIYLEISEQIQKGKAKIVKELVQKAIDEGLPAPQILNEGLLAGMNIIGEKFKNNEVYVPEVLVAARAMNQGMQLLKPLLVEDGVQSKGKVCIGTVQGDLHDIGKNLVKMMMEGKGLEVIDLGTDVSPEAFVQCAIESDCKIICCSALLTTTMDVMADVVKAMETAGIRDKVKIMVGGAPITQSFCDEIGADCYTSDAASAADAAVELCV